MQLPAIFGVRSLPTVLLIKDGRPLDGFLGAQPESAIRALIEPHLGPPPEEPEEAAPDVAPVLDPRERIAQARAAIEREPNKDELKIDLAQALAGNGEADEAERLLEALPANLSGTDAVRKARSQILFARAVHDAPPREALELRVAADPADLRARYQLGARLLSAGEAATALDQFLEIMRRDRKFDGDGGRKALIAAFDQVDDPELIGATRRRMSALIF
jgi:putative thioredoxin